MIESLQKFDRFFGDGLKVPFPAGSQPGPLMNLWDVGEELSRRLVSIFKPRDAGGGRPVHGARAAQFDGLPSFDRPLFYEYFDGDTGNGLGASHQTGWTALVAKLLLQRHQRR